MEPGCVASARRVPESRDEGGALNQDKAPRRVAMVGGGFTGASTAVQLVRASAVPLAITVVEPRERIGPGLAYSATDPDHRLNGPTWSHSIVPDDVGHFTRWCEANSIFVRDPEALAADGNAFVRRADYGDYLSDTLRAHEQWPATGSTIAHLRDRAVAAFASRDAMTIRTADGRTLESDMLVVATGNPLPRLQAPLARSLADHPSVIEDPLQPGRLAQVDPRARVLVLGSGLTALDIASTLVRAGHRGDVVVVSRRGLRPRPQPPAAAPAGIEATDAAAQAPLERIMGAVPGFLLHDVPPTLRGWVRALRSRIREVEARGESWHKGFDELRDVVWRAWPLLPAAEQRRFLRTMRTWYDVHRFRAPPQNDALVRDAEARGRVAFRSARVRAVEPVAGSRALRVRFAGRSAAGERTETFDALVNCTGLDAVTGLRANPFLASLVDDGCLRVDDAGIGFAVDANCCAIGADARARAALRVLGPPTAGTFGDPLGVMFIAAQIWRMLPDALAFLAQARPGPSR